VQLLIPFQVLTDNGNDLAIVFTMCIPIVYILLTLIWKNRNDHNWDSGIFNQQLPPTRDNLLEAYICLAAKMIQSDSKDAGKKIQYIHNYFTKRFPKSSYDFRETITYAYRNPIKTYTVSSWINRNIKRREHKIQIIYFLTGLSMVDGAFNKGELHLLKKISKQLRLSEKEFDSVINMYHSYKRKSKKSIPKKSITEISCKILCISPSASNEEIKKAYRKMAKLHHPDKFHNESQEQQKIAQEKFIIIQKAYDALN